MDGKEEGVVDGHDVWPDGYNAGEGCGDMVGVRAQEVNDAQDGGEVD